MCTCDGVRTLHVFALFHAVGKQRFRKRKESPSLGKILRKKKYNKYCSRLFEREGTIVRVVVRCCFVATTLVLESAIRSTVHRFVGFLLVRTMHACPDVETDRRDVSLSRSLALSDPWNKRESSMIFRSRKFFVMR